MIKYEIRIQYNTETSGMWPISLYVVSHGERLAEFHGDRLLRLLNNARDAIKTEEEKRLS